MKGSIDQVRKSMKKKCNLAERLFQQPRNLSISFYTLQEFWFRLVTCYMLFIIYSIKLICAICYLEILISQFTDHWSIIGAWICAPINSSERVRPLDCFLSLIISMIFVTWWCVSIETLIYTKIIITGLSLNEEFDNYWILDVQSQLSTPKNKFNVFLK